MDRRCRVALVGLLIATGCQGSEPEAGPDASVDPPIEPAEVIVARVDEPLHLDAIRKLESASSLNAMAFDADHNVIAAGSRNGQLFVGKYDRDHKPIWQESFAFGDHAGAVAVGVDPAGLIFVAASATNAAHLGSSWDSVTVALAPDGSVLGQAVIDGVGTDNYTITNAMVVVPGAAVIATNQGTFAISEVGAASLVTTDFGSDIARGPDGDLYITGTHSSGGTQHDPFTRRVTPSGSTRWSFAGGGGGIAVDAAGNAYVTGGSGGAFALIRLDAAGALQWTQPLAGMRPSHLIEVDPAGNAVIAGRADLGKAADDYMVEKVSPAGATLWSHVQPIGVVDWANDRPFALTVGPAGEVFATGEVMMGTGQDDWLIFGIGTVYYGGDGTYYGAHIWQRSPVTTGWATGLAIGLDDGKLFVAGYSEEHDGDRGMLMRFALDRDADGLLDGWETGGIDLDGVGGVELDLRALGANPDHKDLFVEVDGMAGVYDDADVDAALAIVRDAFAAAPVANPDGSTGIAMHIQRDPFDLPFATDDSLAAAWTHFDAIKAAHFGNDGDREARKLAFRYALFASAITAGDEAGTSGTSERPGNDFMVLLGGTWQRVIRAGAANPRSASLRQQTIAGTFMHELGHTLDLGHGGDTDQNKKLNYHSVMNYLWQLPALIDQDQARLDRKSFRQVQASWRATFSSFPPNPADEGRDDLAIFEDDFHEATGFSKDLLHTDHYTLACYANGQIALPPISDAPYEVGPVMLGMATNATAIDLNGCLGREGPSPGEVMRPYNDWAHLDLDGYFMTSRKWKDETFHGDNLGEMTYDDAIAMIGGCATVDGATSCSCVDGAQVPCGNGCGAGTQTCASGIWGLCVPDVAPGDERCNEVDDDCDGATDEAFPAHGAPCTVGIGACARDGVAACTADEQGTACNAIAGAPTGESCNLIDDDCDGATDEGLACVAVPLDGEPLALAPAAPTALAGGTVTYGTANVPHALACPEGTAAVGFHGRSGWSFDGLGLTCAVPRVARRAGPPASYDVVLGAATVAPDAGAPTGTPFDVRCPDNQLVTSTTWWTASNGNGSSIYGLRFTCQPYALELRDGTWQPARGGTAWTSTRVAQPDGSVVTTPVELACPGDQLVTSMTTYTGTWPTYGAITTVNGVSLGCSAATAIASSDVVAPIDGALTATAGVAKVDLSWTAASDPSGIASYRVVVGTSVAPSCSNGPILYEGLGQSFVHRPGPGTYHYRVCARDRAGNLSAGATASAEPLDPGAVPVNGGALSLVAGSVTDLFGGSSSYGNANQEIVRACPAGTVVVGFHGQRGWSFDALGLTCAAPSVAWTSAPEAPYDVALAPAVVVTAAGGTTGTPFDARCPDGQVVASVRLWTASSGNGSSIYGLQLSCRDATITATDGYTMTTTGATTVSERFAQPDASIATTAIDVACPGTELLAAMTAYVGPWPTYGAFTTVNGLRFGCVQPIVPVYGSSQ